VQRHDVALHAYVLMSTHFHLLPTPQSARAIPEFMQELDGRYTQYYNRRYSRVGTLWNGRYRSILIQDEAYLLTCLRYIEQNPVRAGMVSSPAEYGWSSHSAHAFGRWPEWLTPHPLYLALGTSAGARQAAYRTLCCAEGV
jgi:putative transposase